MVEVERGLAIDLFDDFLLFLNQKLLQPLEFILNGKLVLLLGSLTLRGPFLEVLSLVFDLRYPLIILFDLLLELLLDQWVGFLDCFHLVVLVDAVYDALGANTFVEAVEAKVGDLFVWVVRAKAAIGDEAVFTLILA